MNKKITFLLSFFFFTLILVAQSTINIPITASSDDAEENSSGSVDLTSTDLELYNDSNDQEIGLRFQNIIIPAGSTITNAYIQFTVDETDENGPITIGIAGEDVDNSNTFTAATNNISNRPKTTAVVENWTPADWTSVDAAGADQRTPDLSGIVQEIIDRGGWESGNAVSFIIYKPGSVSSTSNNRTAESHDGSGTPPVLHIDFTPPPPSPTAEEIPASANWRYLDDGSDQGTAWRASAFDDNAWSYGNGELGYGDGDETTVVDFGSDLNNKYITTYFRKEFTIADHTAWNSIDLEAIRDDGMVVYLNGSEIWRDNMPTGTINYNTYANSPEIAGSDETIWITNNVTASGLITGTNVIAVEIHQQRASSSDISFNFKLTPKAAGSAPTPTAEEIPANANWRYLDDGSNQATAWRASAFDDSSWSYGNAELGYGDGDETTIVGFGSDLNNKHITTYFRKEFTIADHTAWNSIDLEAIRDDGMVVYLNGTEVWRDNISGTVNYNTLADSPAIGGSDEDTWITSNIPATGLITGTNVIAVEIHQQSVSSSDLSFNFKLTPSIVPVGAPSVVRGPYLQSGTSSSVIIKWRTNNPTESIVNYGTSLGSLSSSESDVTLKTDHEIALTGLTPNTKYYYEIANSSTTYLPESSDMFVVTAPTIGTDTFVRAWILGDPGTEGNGSYPGAQKSVRDAYYAYVDETGPTGSITNPNQTDMVLFLGDNAYNSGTDSEYQAGFFDVYDQILKNTVAWSTLGNHDGYSVNFNTQSGPYYDIFSFPTAAEAGGTASGTEEYYSFDYANIHFIVLQSNNVDGGGNEPAFNTAQKAWLTTDINATTQDWIVAFFHHPPYTKGSHDSDNDGENGLQTMREQYIPILEAGGVDLILSGHSHSYERSKFVNGHTGYSNTFNPAQTTSGGHTVGANGNLSGRADTADLAYSKTDIDTEGAVYITAGSSGKATGAQFNGQDPYTGANTLPVMYYSAQSLGSTILEIEDDGSGGQNMNVKFLRETGAIDDYFTINKSGVTLSTDTNTLTNGEIKLYPMPANSLLNIDIGQSEHLKNIKIFDALGKVVKETQNKQINVSSLTSGLYIVQISTDKKDYFKNIIIN